MPLTSPPRFDLRHWRTRVEDRFGQRAIGVIATMLLELLFIAVLFSLGMSEPKEEERVFVPLTTFDVGEESAPAAAEQDQQQADDSPVEDSAEPVVTPAEVPRPSALPPLPSPVRTPAPPQPDPQPSAQPQPAQQPSPNRPRAVIRQGGGTMGPAGSTGRSQGDSDVVGTAPDGSPLFGARWFREPSEQEMRGYLSGIEPPAYALIACKTAPRWAVTDCVGLEQYPANSNIMNGVLASTWQYQVRPPQRGGRSLVGSWVRIRISVTDRPRGPGAG